MVEASPGVLFVVSTPIGNMGDFSFRAVETLRSVNHIVAEDTRHARKLLHHYGIKTKMSAYHEHNEARATPVLIERLRAGESIALISDAGTPLLSDPGDRLVRAAIDAGITVTPVPGASALLAALVASGLAAVPFTFHGFLGRKGRARSEALREIAACPHTSVVYESPNRLAHTLADLVDVCGSGRPVAVARELTKLHEELFRGTLASALEYYEENLPRGEVVCVIGPAVPEEQDEREWRELARSLSANGMSTRDVVGKMVREHGVPRNIAYRLATES
jgi:16S rRNA (cytidine1402-2'-O)-methyltransferase